MSREDLKDIICRVIENLQECEEGTPQEACIFGDEQCEDVVMRYAIPNPN